MEASEKKERLEYLDLLKALSIFLVVFSHIALIPADSLWGNLLMNLSCCAVPCFMMVTGGLMHCAGRRDLKKTAGRAAGVYLLLCFWKGCYLLFYNALYPAEYSAWGLVKYLFLFGSFENVNTGLFWYLQGYLIMCLCFPATDRLFHGSERERRWLFAAGAAAFGLKYIVRLAGIFSGMEELEGCFAGVLPFVNLFAYFVFGAFLLGERERILKFLQEHSLGRAAFFGVFLVGLLGLTLEKFAQTGHFLWGDEPLTGAYYRVSTLLLALGMYLTVMCVRQFSLFGRWLAREIGPYTMGIYVLHGIVVPCFQLYIYHYFPDSLSVGLNLLTALLTVLICWAVTRLFRKIPVLKRTVL